MKVRNMAEKVDGMLSAYRVLDLTDEKGFFCGKLLGDMGADVIKIERPGGDPSRSVGPFYHDEPHPEKSLFWFAYNTSKRGITLNIATAEGQDLFNRLVKGADVIIESFEPGYMAKLGLGYPALQQVNPEVILVSITPFGQTGPYKHFKAPDIVAMAMGGQMYSYGDADRPPVRISHHSQAYLHSAGQAALGTMMALYHRHATGEGQHVDVSIQESVAWATYMVLNNWDEVRSIHRRERIDPSTGSAAQKKRIWPCKDGYIILDFVSGSRGREKNRKLVEWMDSKGMANDFLKSFDWSRFELTKTTQETVDRMEERISKFAMSLTKAELLEGAAKRALEAFPVCSAKDLLENLQLAARKFWVEIAHPELGTTITYPGPFARVSETPPIISRRAPLIGEHNQEIYVKELGLSKEELTILKEAKAV